MIIKATKIHPFWGNSGIYLAHKNKVYGLSIYYHYGELIISLYSILDFKNTMREVRRLNDY